MRVFIVPFALAVALGSAASAQGQTALQIARQAGVCGNAGIVSAERLPDGRIAVQCATGPVTPDPEITTQTTGGEVAGAGGTGAGATAGAGAGAAAAAGAGAAAGAAAAAGAGAAAPATGFVPLIAPAAAIAGVAGVAAAVAGGSSSSDTQ
jgi:hypothetical protein